MKKPLFVDKSTNFSAFVPLFFGCVLISWCADAAGPLRSPGRRGLSLLGLLQPVVLPRRQLRLLRRHDPGPHQRPPSGPAAEPHHPEDVLVFLPAWTAAHRCGTRRLCVSPAYLIRNTHILTPILLFRIRSYSSKLSGLHGVPAPGSERATGCRRLDRESS